jgi:hypothetical protein
MAKFDPLKMLLGPLAGGTIYDSPIAQLLSIKDPNEKRRLEAEAEAEAKKSAAPGMKPADARGGMRHGGMRHGGMKHGGAVKKMAKGGMPSIEESIKSGNRVSRQVGEETKRMMPPKKRTMPSPGESVKSGNRIAREEGAEMRKMRMAKGGVTRADGCAVRGKTKGKMV